MSFVTEKSPAMTSSASLYEKPTLRSTLSALKADVRRKRRQMRRSVSPLSLFLGCLSINIIAVAVWRFSIYFEENRLHPLAMILYYVNIVLFSFDASTFSSVGPGIVVVHLVGCTIHAKFGKNCTLYGRNGIGGLGKGDIGGWRGGPILGDNVTVGYGGNIICHERIGDNVTIGAGAWCFQGVEDDSIVVGLPAKVLRKKTGQELREEAETRGA